MDCYFVEQGKGVKEHLFVSNCSGLSQVIKPNRQTIESIENLA